MDREQIKEILNDCIFVLTDEANDTGELMGVDEATGKLLALHEASLPQVGEDGILDFATVNYLFEQFAEEDMQKWIAQGNFRDEVSGVVRGCLRAQALATTIREREKARQEKAELIKDMESGMDGLDVVIDNYGDISGSLVRHDSLRADYVMIEASHWQALKKEVAGE